MTMFPLFLLVDVAATERAFLVHNGVPVRQLPPGRHRVWRGANAVDVVRFPLAALTVELTPALRALTTPDQLQVVVVQASERAVLVKDGRPVRVLGEGEHLVWRVDGVVVDVIDAAGVACAPLRDARRALLAAHGYVEAVVPEGAVGLRFVDGVLDAELPPGRHAAWSVMRDVTFVVVDRRERSLAIAGQEVMTKDRVSLRLNATVQVQVADPRRLAMTTKDADAQVYLLAQLALRDAVATHTLDELLADRALLADRVKQAIAPQCARFGVDVQGVGVKDLILPGEMRTLLNRVIEAQKEAEANVISRREETAAVRSMAQTAKVLQENPLLVRLKELEAYKDLAGKVGTLHVVLGDGALGKLELKT
jgi:regulator of protease activity HflC (stomatin/prohibitin superfamily)